MYEIEAIAAVRDFVELGGDVLLVIAFVTFVMWTGMVRAYEMCISMCMHSMCLYHVCVRLYHCQ